MNMFNIMCTSDTFSVLQYFPSAFEYLPLSRVLRLDILRIAKHIQCLHEARFTVQELPEIALFCSVDDQIITRSSSLTDCRSVRGLVAFHASTLPVAADPAKPGKPSYIAAHHHP